jgi:dihydrofolate reductase
LNIVITRDSNWSAEGVKVVSGLGDAIEVGEGQALIDGVEEAVIIGGAQIYAQSLSIVDRLYLTQVEAEPEGDAYFPEIDYSQWQELGRQSFPAGDQPNRYPYSFIVYDRKEA